MGQAVKTCLGVFTPRSHERRLECLEGRNENANKVPLRSIYNLHGVSMAYITYRASQVFCPPLSLRERGEETPRCVTPAGCKVTKPLSDCTLLLLRRNGCVAFDGLDTLDALDLGLGRTDFAVGNVLLDPRWRVTRQSIPGLERKEKWIKHTRSP